MAWSKAREEAKAYQDEVALWTRQAVLAQRWLRLDGPAQCWLRLLVPDRRVRDLDGPVKAILDGLTAGGAWRDDSLCERLIVDKERGELSAVVLIRAKAGG